MNQPVKRGRGRPRKDPNAPPKPKKEKQTTGKRRGRPPKNILSSTMSESSEESTHSSLLASEDVKKTYADHNVFMSGVGKLTLAEAIGKLVEDLEIELNILSPSAQKYLSVQKRKALIQRLKELV